MEYLSYSDRQDDTYQDDRYPERRCIPVPQKTELASFLFTLALGLIPTPAQALLEQSDRCSSVADLQSALWDSGFDPGGVDGVFGNGTRAAVEAFQRDRGLVDDGVVGFNTASALGLDPYVACAGDVAEEEISDSYAVAAWSSNAWVNTLSGPLNVRSAPSVEAEIIDALPQGSEVSLDSDVSGDWVQLSSGGWVATAWLSFQPVETSSATVASSSSPTGEAGYTSYRILAGWTIEDVAYYLESLGFFSASEFLAAASEIPYNAFPWLPSGLYDLEGFLYPDTYEIAVGATPYAVIDQMLSRFESSALPVYDQSGTYLSLYDWVILASIVEQEAFYYEEQPLIASVFLNRLYYGKRLEADPTVEYALGIQQTPESPLTLSEVRTDSPYNTYLYGGLPPGPIGNPGTGSLDAVLYPADTDHLFFVACYDGTHEFNYTLEDHEQDRDTICAASRG
ncbi:MAG: hypothetical protein RLZZ435_2703 [Cyanobacteriota bacterium]|jgi:UPF0755 protein